MLLSPITVVLPYTKIVLTLSIHSFCISFLIFTQACTTFMTHLQLLLLHLMDVICIITCSVHLCVSHYCSAAIYGNFLDFACTSLFNFFSDFQTILDKINETLAIFQLSPPPPIQCCAKSFQNSYHDLRGVGNLK